MAFPDRAFTMSEIMRATNINVASCHALLNALTDAGYITRFPKDKTYILGPALAAAGDASLLAHPLIARAKEAAEVLYREIEKPVLLLTLVGDETLALKSISDRAGRSVGMRLGQRLPLVPPVGAHFVAWDSEARIEAWIAKASKVNGQTADDLRSALKQIRARGFEVMLRVTVESGFAALLNELASAPEQKQAVNLISTHGWRLIQPIAIEPTELYDVALIAAPIFDQTGRPPLSLCIGGISEQLTGAQISLYSDQLLRICLRVMATAAPQSPDQWSESRSAS